jgi:two-component system, cell cycle sensor histidine kinase and response regulator CckA
MQLSTEVEKVSVVLVEDNLGDAHLIRQMVRRQVRPPFELAHARSLEQAQGRIEAVHPDAVLLDLNLPDGRGLDTVRRVRAIDAHVPIIVLTGVDDQELALQAMSEGAQDYLVKGAFSDEVFSRSVRYAIARVQQLRTYQDTLQRLARAEKLEAIGRLAGGVVHDFNNLLTVVQTHASLLRRSEDPHVREHAQSIHGAVQQAAALTDQLLSFCRGRPHRRTSIDLNTLVLGMQPMLRRLIGDDIHLAVEVPPEPVHVIGDRGQLEQIILNLVINARDAVGTNGAIKLRTEVITPSEGALAGKPAGLLSVSDDGVGMDEHTAAHLFEPFFSTKEYGHGLGLASVFGLVQQSSGEISVRTAPGAGSELRVLLPTPPMSSQKLASVRPPVPQPVSGERCVLLIEDDDMLRDVVCVALQQVGYRVLSARDGVEAVSIAERQGREIDSIITDIMLPGPPGTQLAPRLTKHCPGAPILFVSGWAGADPALPSLEVPTAFLPKPFSSRDLLRALDRLHHGRD